jgi:hypothetical protein
MTIIANSGEATKIREFSSGCPGRVRIFTNGIGAVRVGTQKNALENPVGSVQQGVLIPTATLFTDFWQGELWLIADTVATLVEVEAF